MREKEKTEKLRKTKPRESAEAKKCKAENENCGANGIRVYN